MRAIDADALRESVLKWLPPDPCGVEENEHPYETDICVSMLMEIEDAPTIEPEKRTEERTETHACDLIERQAAIRWVKTECNPYGKPTLDFESGKKVIEHLKQMPSAQADLPIKEKCAFCPHCNNCDVNDDLSIQPCVDTISRQAVIENICTMLRNCFDASDEMIESVKITVGELPSAQSEIVRCKSCVHRKQKNNSDRHCYE